MRVVFAKRYVAYGAGFVDNLEPSVVGAPLSTAANGNANADKTRLHTKKARYNKVSREFDDLYLHALRTVDRERILTLNSVENHCQQLLLQERASFAWSKRVSIVGDYVRAKLLYFLAHGYEKCETILQTEVENLKRVQAAVVRKNGSSHDLQSCWADATNNFAISAKKNLRMVLEKVGTLIIEGLKEKPESRKLGVNPFNWVVFDPEVQRTLWQAYKKLNELSGSYQDALLVEQTELEKVPAEGAADAYNRESRAVKKADELVAAEKRVLELQKNDKKDELEEALTAVRHTQKGLNHYRRGLKDRRGQFPAWMEAKEKVTALKAEVHSEVKNVLTVLDKRIAEAASVV